MPTALAEPQDVVAEAIRNISAIATLPEITARIVATVEDPSSTASRLHQIVSHDPALVSRILKVVNSSFYGRPGQIGSVERAIVMLGLNAVKNLAVAASLGQLFRGRQLCDGFTPRDLWTHCIAVAVVSRELAKQMKLPTAEEAFLAGMIHDLGLIVSLQSHPEKLGEVCDAARQDSSEDFCEIDRRIIGADHQQLGAALAEQWKFPRSCQLVAGHHHRPGELADDQRTLVAIVYAADILSCRDSSHGFNLTAAAQSFDEGLLRSIGLDGHILQNVGARLNELMEGASALFA
jgi:putative nucleotidyltransferase with HDIG domain